MSAKKINVEELLRAGQPVQFPIQGWSMYPFLSDGDIVTVQPCTVQTIQINDAVLYRRAGGPLVLHRIVRITSEGYYLCGDNQSKVEGPLKRSQIFGILSEYVHNGKHIVCSQPGYQIKTKIWRHLLPLRRPISKAVHSVKQKASR